ncbi:SMP-30/gluconolactonase/LRE family protein [Pseudogemmobacter bohemicus]|uniref:SMP-30/gluconolactonase/LRE family protein n=1 Tax=Pseudogemmobacter bohemicus TaxID=2250708 RepID=UPI000DD3BF43|nr:SMP-30/gluconolactonase/LRE family protein [Pseudogemmobacter bohemicus]
MIPFDTRICELGEGAFWHQLRGQFFWFDILNRRLLSPGREWRFDRMASAAAVIDRDRLMVATETGLAILNLENGALTDHIAIEADRPETRSNDGRADRQNGFWFSTMGKRAEPGAGSIYRYFRGRVERLFTDISIPNAISFAPDGRSAWFADTARGIVWSQKLDAEGWPEGERAIFLDLNAEGLNPDGATVDSEGGLWIAKWGAGAVMRYGPDGRRSHAVKVGGHHASCPAFGGADLGDMLVTTAREGIKAPDMHQGLPWLVRPGFRGLPEPQVIL